MSPFGNRLADPSLVEDIPLQPQLTKFVVGYHDRRKLAKVPGDNYAVVGKSGGAVRRTIGSINMDASSMMTVSYLRATSARR